VGFYLFFRNLHQFDPLTLDTAGNNGSGKNFNF
jgi:hypothetical protein